MTDVSISGVQRRSALLVVDMQNAFLKPAGSLAKLGLSWQRLTRAQPNCIRLVAAARRSGRVVIYTKHGYAGGYRNGGRFVTTFMPAIQTVHGLLANTWDTEIVAELAPDPGDAVIEKCRPSAFIGTGLDVLLRASRIEEVVVCGVTTNVCVESTVRDAAQRDYTVSVVADATAEYTIARQRAAIASMASHFASAVTTSDTVAMWKERE